MAIMPITAAASAATNAATQAAATTNRADQNASDSSAASLNYDSFLKLMIAQMKNQDPTDPVDASEQMSQLASFSQVEQTIKTNKNLIAMMQQTALSQAADIIGKTVISADGKTTGVVKAVEVNSDGMVATLTNGGKVTLEQGITISATAPATTQ